jgi:S-adenosylmethionine uptake transporter
VFLLLSLVGYFHALTRLPLVLTVTISYLAPIFIAVLSIPVLGERPSRSIWAALAAGLTGVLMATLPEWNAAASADGSPRIWGMCSAAAAALSFAIVMLLARRQAQRDSVWSILLIQSVLPLLMLTPFAAWHWAPVQTGDVLRALLAGGLGTLGLLCLTQAFTRLEASRAAALDYTSFVWASLLGYLMFGEVPSWSNVASAALIVSGCLLLLRR